MHPHTVVPLAAIEPRAAPKKINLGPSKKINLGPSGR